MLRAATNHCTSHSDLYSFSFHYILVQLSKMSHAFPFDASKWIGTRQNYPELNIPKDVLYKHRRLLQIPPYYHGFVPKSTVTIQELLDTTSLPSFDNNSNFKIVSFLFTSTQPDINLSFDLITRPIPPLAITKTLLQSFGQQWFDGAKSVQDPRDASHFLPFWVISYWSELGNVLEARQAWYTAQIWITECVEPSHLQFLVVQDVLTSLKTLGWNVRLQGAADGMQSREWAGFLSSTKVKGGFVDAMINTICLQVQCTSHLSSIVTVEPLSFSHALQYDKSRWKQYDFDRGFARLRNIGDTLCDGSQEQLLFPINIDGIHWTLFKIDGSARQINYGDTLGWAWPKNDVERIQLWLCQHDQSPFEKGHDLVHGIQQDGYSCAIGMVNTARHDLFGDILFTDANKNILRLQEFLLVVESHNILGAVSLPFHLVLDISWLTFYSFPDF